MNDEKVGQSGTNAPSTERYKIECLGKHDTEDGRSVYSYFIPPQKFVRVGPNLFYVPFLRHINKGFEGDDSELPAYDPNNLDNLGLVVVEKMKNVPAEIREQFNESLMKKFLTNGLLENRLVVDKRIGTKMRFGLESTSRNDIRSQAIITYQSVPHEIARMYARQLGIQLTQ